MRFVFIVLTAAAAAATERASATKGNAHRAISGDRASG